MICKLCGEDKNLIKAHIIPEGFFRPLRYGSIVPEIHSNTNGVFPKRSPSGIYDKNILCEKCDKYIGSWDGYAHQLLIQNFSEEFAVHKGNTKAAYKIDNFNYKKLKLFFYLFYGVLQYRHNHFIAEYKLDHMHASLKK